MNAALSRGYLAMQTATRHDSRAMEILQETLQAQGEQIRTILEKLGSVPERADVAKVAEQMVRFGEVLSGIEEKLARGEQILTALDEFQFGPVSDDSTTLKRIKDRRLASRLR